MPRFAIILELGTDGHADTVAALEDILEALVRINQRELARLPAMPCCPGCGGVRYVPPPARDVAAGTLRLTGASCMLVDGIGACGPLSAYVCAQKRRAGHRCRVRVYPQHPTERRYHAVVQYDDGTIEDPSADLLAEQAAVEAV